MSARLNRVTPRSRLLSTSTDERATSRRGASFLDLPPRTALLFRQPHRSEQLAHLLVEIPTPFPHPAPLLPRRPPLAKRADAACSGGSSARPATRE
mmetsp:Transcript_4810/g.11708  ORF Transcript_4810/g.11708 Transcript_4810/m.11708 type:complete len:96 (-) Transcript_4810:297-584(-)